MKRFLKLSSSFLIALSITATHIAVAQLTTASMSGTVKDKTGQPLPGATVRATHEPSGSVYGTTSRDDGSYTIPGMRIGGPYTLSVSYVGYKKEETKNITLALAQNARFDFSLVEEAVQAQEVVVRGERSAVMSASNIGAATNVGRERIDQLPSIARTFTDFYKLSPYFSGGAGVQGGSAANRNSKYNNVQIDGADYNDQFGLGSSGTAGGQATTVSVAPMTLEAIEEFQLVISPYDVRQGGFTGAGINAVTRSGTNQFKGSVFYNGRNESFAGLSPDALQAKLPGFSETSAGFRLGGPIIENSLFFFASGEMARRGAPFTRTYDNAKVGTNASTALIDSLTLISNFLRSNYGYETGSWTNIPAIDNSDKFFARLDFNISDEHKLVARWNYLNATDDNRPSRFGGTADFYSENARYKLKNTTHSIAFELHSVLGNEMANEMIVGYMDQLDQPVYYGTAFPTVEIRTNGSGTDQTVQRLAVGAEEFRHQNELQQKHLEITDNFTLYMPNHTVTAGFKYDNFKYRNLFISDNFGFYQYNSVNAFLNSATVKANVYTYKYSATADSLQQVRFGANQIGFYVQDEWAVSPTFKVTAGVRFDIPSYPDKPNYNARFDSTFTANGYHLSTDKLPAAVTNISPRIGFNWSLDAERSSQLRGGVGVFTGRFPAVWVSNQYSNDGVDFYTVTTIPNSFIANPYGQPKIASGLPTAEIDITDPNFKAPSILRTNLALDQKVSEDLTATVEGIFSRTQNDVYYKNINLAGTKTNSGFTPNGKIVGENREVWATINTATGAYNSATANANQRQINPAFTAVYLITNTNQGSNANLMFQLERQNNTDGFYGKVAYTYGYAKDVGGQNSTTASSGFRFNPTPGDPNNPPLAFADNDRRHRVLATASYKYDWGMDGFSTTVGLFYNGFSGVPYSWVVNGDVNGDGFTDNDLIYIPKDENDIILMTAASGGVQLPKSDIAYAQLFKAISADPYMSTHRGQVLQRNSLRSPWSGQVDLRIAQEIPSIMGHNIQFIFDVQNLMNLLNKNWGWQRISVSNPFFLQFNSFSTASNGPTQDVGKARYFWTNPSDPSVPSNFNSRWSALLGVRYTF